MGSHFPSHLHTSACYPGCARQHVRLTEDVLGKMDFEECWTIVGSVMVLYSPLYFNNSLLFRILRGYDYQLVFTRLSADLGDAKKGRFCPGRMLTNFIAHHSAQVPKIVLWFSKIGRSLIVNV